MAMPCLVSSSGFVAYLGRQDLESGIGDWKVRVWGRGWGLCWGRGWGLWLARVTGRRKLEGADVNERKQEHVMSTFLHGD